MGVWPWLTRKQSTATETDFIKMGAWPWLTRKQSTATETDFIRMAEWPLLTRKHPTTESISGMNNQDKRKQKLNATQAVSK